MVFEIVSIFIVIDTSFNLFPERHCWIMLISITTLNRFLNIFLVYLTCLKLILTAVTIKDILKKFELITIYFKNNVINLFLFSYYIHLSAILWMTVSRKIKILRHNSITLWHQFRIHNKSSKQLVSISKHLETVMLQKFCIYINFSKITNK